MSKLKTELNAKVFPALGTKPISTMNYLEVRSSIEQLPFDEKYVVEARIRMDATMTQDLLRDAPWMRQRVIEQMKQAIVEELFGEFRPHLHNLRFAIYKNDQREALDILNKLMEQMYNEG